MKKKAKGVPAVLILAGGISRHGRHCHCPYCKAEYASPPERKTMISCARTDGGLP